MYLITYSPGYLSYLNCLRLMLNCCILRRNLLGNLHIKEFIVLANSKFSSFLSIFLESNARCYCYTYYLGDVNETAVYLKVFGCIRVAFQVFQNSAVLVDMLDFVRFRIDYAAAAVVVGTSSPVVAAVAVVAEPSSLYSVACGEERILVLKH